MADWTIHLRAKPTDVPVEVRIRQLLKIALRRFGLRAIEVNFNEVLQPAEPAKDGDVCSSGI